MNFLQTAWMECPFKLVLVASCLMDAIHALNCPPIFITTRERVGPECWPECPEGKYCHYGRCRICSPCRDPFTMAKQGKTELVIIAECIDKGSCPNSCESDILFSTGNATLCNCVDVTPPPPTVPPTIACKVGCKHGGCVKTGECNCDDGWSGVLCDECIPDPECQHGQCNETERCLCNQDWDGINCDQDVSYCAMNQPCLNEGRCENDGNGGYTCTCSEGFTGAICENGTSGNQLVLFLTVFVSSAILLFVTASCIVFLWKKCKVLYYKSKRSPGCSSNSGMPLLTNAIDYRLEGTKVFLEIKPAWKPCFLKTCKCLMEAPLRISEDSGTEVSVPNLRVGFKYNFKIYKYKTTSPDVEGSDCSMAKCEVSVEFTASENEEGNCAETIGKALVDVATKKALNRPLEADRRLRERVACFFEMTSDHQKSFIGGQTQACRHIDILQEVLESCDLIDKRIGELLSHLAEESSDKTEDFVEILTKFHPTCQSCARLWHQTHGGTTVSSQSACNGVATDTL